VITTFYLPTRIIFGPESFSQLGSEAAKLGRTVLLVTGKSSLRETGVLETALADLQQNGVEVRLFDRAVPNPRTLTIDEGARLVHQEKLDCIIGLGGGSAMDTAKGIRLASAGERPFWDYMAGFDVKPTGHPLPLILVPTLAATGSEANNIASVTNDETREKQGCFNNSFYPTLSIVDPALTLSAPPHQVATGGVDVFCHVVEGYITSPAPSPVNDGIMETVMRAVVAALADRSDLAPRLPLSWASTLACSQFVTLGGGYGQRTLHLISNPLSGYYDVTHADCLSAMLPAWMAYTQSAVPERFRQLGQNVFQTSDGLAATTSWLEKVGMKLRLRDLGVKTDQFDFIAARAAQNPVLRKHPNPLDAAVISRLYAASY
jgi:alcohol dehydrogenase YqhD (iron-dependent ADH family)